MAGLAWSGVGSPDGRWLLTLYLNTGRKLAFVHALDLVRSSPLCIFLPSNGASGALKRYGLTLSPDGRRLGNRYERCARRSGRDRPCDAEGCPHHTLCRDTEAQRPWLAHRNDLAQRAHALLQPGRDLWAYDIAYGIVRGPYRTGGAIDGFGFFPGYCRVHALRADGRLLTFDAATGGRVA